MIFDKQGLIIDEYDNDTEVTSMIIEAAMLDEYSGEEIEGILENTYDIGKAVNEDILVERSIVRLDKQAKTKKAEKMAVFQVAKQKGDKEFKKLLTLWKLEKFIERRLEKRYAAQAKQLAKQAMKKAAQTKSKAVGTPVKKMNLLLNKKKAQ